MGKLLAGVSLGAAALVLAPGAKAGPVNFLMYPVAETAEGRLDSYAPDAFKYTITATEIKG